MPTALITGITGQDGSYLAELLLSKGYRVVGMARRASTVTYERIQHLLDDMVVIQGDLTDQGSLLPIFEEVRTDRGLQPGGAIVRADVMEPAGTHRRCHRARASRGCWRPSASSIPRSASTRRRPARCSARSWKYRRGDQRRSIRAARTGLRKSTGTGSPSTTASSFGLFAVSGILFNHESPRRGLEFVTRKISDGVARIKLGLARELRLGNLDSRRDWGYAGDYVKAMWMMLQQDKPDDYVVGNGRNAQRT